MPWAVKYNPKLQIVELTYTGRITERELHEATSTCIKLGKENGTFRFFVDASKLELSPSLIDFYSLPTKQYQEENVDPRSRQAVIAPTDPIAKEAAVFYETVCRNRGWMVRVFSGRQEAIDWLMRVTSPDVM